MASTRMSVDSPSWHVRFLLSPKTRTCFDAWRKISTFLFVKKGYACYIKGSVFEFCTVELVIRQPFRLVILVCIMMALCLSFRWGGLSLYLSSDADYPLLGKLRKWFQMIELSISRTSHKFVLFVVTSLKLPGQRQVRFSTMPAFSVYTVLMRTNSPKQSGCLQSCCLLMWFSSPYCFSLSCHFSHCIRLLCLTSTVCCRPQTFLSSHGSVSINCFSVFCSPCTSLFWWAIWTVNNEQQS